MDTMAVKLNGLLEFAGGRAFLWLEDVLTEAARGFKVELICGRPVDERFLAQAAVESQKVNVHGVLIGMERDLQVGIIPRVAVMKVTE